MVASRCFLVFVLSLPVCTAEPRDDLGPPTAQPPTRGQDFGRCAWAALPEVINLAPVESSWFHRTGKWADKMGAELVSWDQNRVRIDYTNLDYYVDLKPWFHTKALKNPELELEHMRIWLPEPKNKNYRASTTVVYMDCEGTPMYVSREFKNQDYEIFNHLGQLVATAHPSEMVKGQLYFKDDKGTPFAIAASPTVGEVASGETEFIPQWHQYDFNHWQVWFMAGFNSITYLKEPDHRWVIAAVVQEHAILQTYAHHGPENPLPAQYVLCLTLIALGCLAAVGFCLASCRNIFFMVYPPKKAEKGNPFLVDDIGGITYGTANPWGRP